LVSARRHSRGFSSAWPISIIISAICRRRRGPLLKRIRSTSKWPPKARRFMLAIARHAMSRALNLPTK
jgi:hypothetical protein